VVCVAVKASLDSLLLRAPRTCASRWGAVWIDTAIGRANIKRIFGRVIGAPHGEQEGDGVILGKEASREVAARWRRKWVRSSEF
jgi:hypothetical protein